MGLVGRLGVVVGLGVGVFGSFGSLLGQESGQESKGEVLKGGVGLEERCGSCWGVGCGSVDVLTECEVGRLMGLGSVKSVLDDRVVVSGGSVAHVVYDSVRKITNYDELVFQEGRKLEDRKPVIAFFYVSRPSVPLTENQVLCVKRSAVVFRKLAGLYEGRVEFVAFDMDVDVERKRQGGVRPYSQFVTKFGISSFPALIMYSMFDVVKGEGVDKKGGLVKIDAQTRGPLEDKFIIPSFDNNRDYWVLPNLFGGDTPDGDGGVWRYCGEYKLKKVGVLQDDVKRR